MPPEPLPSPFQNEIMGEDAGHKALIQDLYQLWRDAGKYYFHDYKGNNKFPMPKVALVCSLEKIIQRAKTGYYNNHL